ncbi:MAG: hypothetical protein CMO07_12295 [Thalassospira sp.]|uniref:Uncharacterized protein n=1 Tax=Thalassospira profundimaris TaxID=502049 RepID=A0A367WRT9_9PROT|nr:MULTISPECIES: hypothetical protein [Thalassospira]MBE71473.1 hypothetical protein [Thalassospira sp.]KZD02188.1 hypothetical protein AUQ41_01685 [Thalassospira sp. MCCC 1A02898]MBO9506895.1 hypothetical protein [Thalassospira sp. A3_1]ONH89436.1 hypothetical protein TH47_05040 [Thalassospira sp. MCCC 1A02803]RCK43271.1 hypothetical protein TH30_19870 [Thalassospira profundimaris]|tara:strand:- start:8130 stop:9677 length:1548 start_codon:yes stop_codon:yes gene_type:complete
MTENDTEKMGGFIAREHHKLRFTELCETFFARLVLMKCPDPKLERTITVQLSLCDFFRKVSKEALVSSLAAETIRHTHKMSELVGDALSALTGVEMSPTGEEKTLLEHYQDHIATRLKWLETGSEVDELAPCVERVSCAEVDGLQVFDIAVCPKVLCEEVSKRIPFALELSSKLLMLLATAQNRPGDSGPRIDFRKQVELLVNQLDERFDTTGETEFTLLSNRIPFRWAIQVFDNMDLTMLGIGTSGLEDKILLPLFLEVNGYLDLIDLDLESDPRERNDVVVRYFVRRPAKQNIFGAVDAGLSPQTRSLLNETELVLYHRLHQHVRQGLVFGGKAELEQSFGAICSGLLRRASFCIEEPSLMRELAEVWLEQHKDEKTLQIEDKFFLPFIYERLRSEFGARVVKKPERFGGEADILFDDSIPIELKVRRGRKKPIDLADIEKAFPPGGQAASYAAISRLGFVLVLDLPEEDASVVSLENCVTTLERRYPEDAMYPTCIVVIVFRCVARSPSKSR